MNKKTIAREWLVFIATFIVGLFLLPATIFMIFHGNMNDFGKFYQILLSTDDSDFTLSWLIATAPYLLVQSTRLTIWSVKQVRDK